MLNREFIIFALILSFVVVSLKCEENPCFYDVIDDWKNFKKRLERDTDHAIEEHNILCLEASKDLKTRLCATLKIDGKIYEIDDYRSGHHHKVSKHAHASHHGKL